jgi:hypothetical protein
VNAFALGMTEFPMVGTAPGITTGVDAGEEIRRRSDKRANSGTGGNETEGGSGLWGKQSGAIRATVGEQQLEEQGNELRRGEMNEKERDQ